MTLGAVHAIPAAPRQVLDVRRWARLNLWAVLAFVAVTVVAFSALPPRDHGNAERALLAATLPVAILEAVLLVAILRLFRGRQPAVSLGMLGAGLASIGVGSVAVVLELIGAEPAGETLTTVAGFATTLELFLIGALLHRSNASPATARWVAIFAGLAFAAGPTGPETPDVVMLVVVLMTFALPLLLYQLTRIDVPQPGASAP